MSKLSMEKCIRSHYVCNQWSHRHAICVVHQQVLYCVVITTKLQTPVTCDKGFISHSRDWLWVSCGPAPCFALFPQPSRRSGPNLGNVLLQEEVKNNGSTRSGSETHALIRVCPFCSHSLC